MKIALLSRFFLPIMLGGEEIHVHNLARLLSKKHDVHVFTTTDNTEKNHVEKEMIVEKDGSIIHYMHSFFGYINPNLEEFDIIHIHGYHRSFTGTILAKWSNKKIILTLHGAIWGPYFEKSLISNFKKFHDKIIAKRLIERVSKIICICESERCFLIKEFGVNKDKIEVVPNGITEDAFVIENTPRRIDYPYILMIGRIAKIKRMDMVIKIMQKLPDQLHLIIAGNDGGELKNLVLLASKINVANRVHFIGPVFGKEKYSLMRNTLGLIIASWFESQSIVALESMIQGTPIIASKVGGIPDIVENIHDCYLYDYGDKDSLRKYIMQLFENRKNVSKISSDSLSIYRWDNITERILEVYKNGNIDKKEK